MRILHVTTYLQGGAGRAITDLALAQHARGDAVMVVASEVGEPGYGNYEEYLDRLSAAGVRVLLVDSTFVRALPRLLQAAADVAGALEAPPDVVHAHAGVPSVVGLLVAGMRTTGPLLQTMHGWAEHRLPEHARADVLAMRAARAVVVPSRAAFSHLRDAGVPPSHVRIVPYGIAPLDPADRPDDDVSATAARWRAEGRQVLCCIGTIGARKNQRALIDAIGSSEMRDRVGLLLVGEGDAGEVRNAITGWRLADTILVTGYRPRASRLLEAADWLVLPSQREGLPLAVLEAFRGGLPVIVADTPELREVVDHGSTGIVAPGVDMAAILDGLRQAVALSSVERAGWASAAAQRWRDRYQLATMVERYDGIYADVSRDR